MNLEMVERIFRVIPDIVFCEGRNLRIDWN